MSSSAQQGFVDPYNYSYPGIDSSAGMANANEGLYKNWGSSGFPGIVARFMGFDTDRYYQELDTARNQEYERQSINSARAWSEYMDNTQVQRRVEDIKKAGLNPWLAVQSGLSGTGAPSVDTGGSAQHQTHSNQSKTGLATLLMAIAKILG